MVLLYSRQPREREDPQRCILSAARTLLRARLTGLVLDASLGAGCTPADAAPRQDGQGNQHRATDDLMFN